MDIHALHYSASQKMGSQEEAGGRLLGLGASP